MRRIQTDEIAEAVRRCLIGANYSLPDDIAVKIGQRANCEENALAKSILQKLEDNMRCAKEINVPVCQDTGLAVLFFEIGQQVCLTGTNFEDAVNDGVRRAYEDGYLRKSVVSDPLFDRANTKDNTPAVIHTRIVPGDRVKVTVVPKGFGSENMSRINMFSPAADKDDIVRFVTETVTMAGGSSCPPVVVGVGIGGDFELCALLAKKALCRGIDEPNPDGRYAALEQELLCAINQTGVGPAGFGGETTALGVNVEYFPTHIAGLPCAVNLGCHVTRHESVVL